MDDVTRTAAVVCTKLHLTRNLQRYHVSCIIIITLFGAPLVVVIQVRVFF